MRKNVVEAAVVVILYVPIPGEAIAIRDIIT